MKKTRKLSAMLVAAALLASVSGTAFAASSVPGAVYGDSQAAGVNKPVTVVAADLTRQGIRDVTPQDWYAGSVTVLVEAGVMTPASNGSFAPSAGLSTTDGVAAFAKVLGVASKTDTPAQALAKAHEAGLVSGNASPAGDLSRMEVARMLAKALGVTPVAEAAPFSDAAGLPPADQGILAALYKMGVFKGFPDGTFQPDGVLTRAQLAVLVDRILGAK